MRVLRFHVKLVVFIRKQFFSSLGVPRINDKHYTIVPGILLPEIIDWTSNEKFWTL